MRTVGSYEAKTHLSQLLAEVEGGQVIAITKHGRTIALLTPAANEGPAARAVASIRRNRRNITLGKGLSIKSMINEGRK